MHELLVTTGRVHRRAGTDLLALAIVRLHARLRRRLTVELVADGRRRRDLRVLQRGTHGPVALRSVRGLVVPPRIHSQLGAFLDEIVACSSLLDVVVVRIHD